MKPSNLVSAHRRSSARRSTRSRGHSKMAAAPAVVDTDDEDDADSDAVSEWLTDPDLLDTTTTLVSHDPVAYRLAFERCMMLDRPETIDQFLNETWALLFTDVARLCGPNWASCECRECTIGFIFTLLLVVCFGNRECLLYCIMAAMSTV